MSSREIRIPSSCNMISCFPAELVRATLVRPVQVANCRIEPISLDRPLRMLVWCSETGARPVPTVLVERLGRFRLVVVGAWRWRQGCTWPTFRHWPGRKPPFRYRPKCCRIGRRPNPCRLAFPVPPLKADGRSCGCRDGIGGERLDRCRALALRFRPFIQLEW